MQQPPCLSLTSASAHGMSTLEYVDGRNGSADSQTLRCHRRLQPPSQHSHGLPLLLRRGTGLALKGITTSLSRRTITITTIVVPMPMIKCSSLKISMPHLSVARRVPCRAMVHLSVFLTGVGTARRSPSKVASQAAARYSRRLRGSAIATHLMPKFPEILPLGVVKSTVPRAMDSSKAAQWAHTSIRSAARGSPTNSNFLRCTPSSPDAATGMMVTVRCWLKACWRTENVSMAVRKSLTGTVSRDAERSSRSATLVLMKLTLL